MIKMENREIFTNSTTSCSTLEFQKQRLSKLIELISNQEATLNSLKSFRKLAKDQTAINAELTNELNAGNDAIAQKDKELKEALNKVDNLKRQLSHFRRTRAYRNTKNVSNTNNISRSPPGQPAPSPPPPTTTNNINNNINNNNVVQNNISANSLNQNATTTTPTTTTTNNNNIIPLPPIANNNSNTNNIINSNNNKISIDNSDDSSSSTSPISTDVAACPILDTDPTPPEQQQQQQSNSSSPNSHNNRMIDKSMNIRKVSFDPLALLLDAALEGELELVIKTSKQVPDLSASHDECVTALHNAVVAGHYDVAKYLIEAGCDVNVQDSDGWTPLHCAASANNLPLVKLLIENNALIYATTTSDFATPLMKCEEKEDNYKDCYNYLMRVQNNLGVINDGLVYALYDYEAQKEDELSFVAGDELIILRRDDSQEQAWWWARKRAQQTSDTVVDIKEGYIPRNLVGLYPPKNKLSL